jgi:hypothetical protein
MVLMTVAFGALAVGCSGKTTGATVISERGAATLHATGSCDTQCEVYFHVESRGGTANHAFKTKVFTVGKIGNTPFSVKVTGLMDDKDYVYRVCGRERGWKSFVCVGPDGKTTSWSSFRTFRP